MYQLRHEMFGKKEGNFRPATVDEIALLDNLKRQITKNGITGIFAPHCARSTRVTRLGNGHEIYKTPWLARTKPGFDGGMVFQPKIALAMFNADCPAVILFDRNLGHLAMLHAGFRCLVPQDAKETSIISKKNLQELALDLHNLEAFIGYGAGPCCYGVNNYKKDLENPKFMPFISEARKGPCKGQLSLDLHGLAAQQLRDCGVKGCITIDHTCTACFGRNDVTEGIFHSNIYEWRKDSDTVGRNLVLTWFT